MFTQPWIRKNVSVLPWFALAVKLETTHKPPKPATNQPNQPENTHLSAKNCTLIFLKTFFMIRFKIRTNYDPYTHTAREERWLHSLIFLSEFAFRLFHCTVFDSFTNVHEFFEKTKTCDVTLKVLWVLARLRCPLINTPKVVTPLRVFISGLFKVWVTNSKV